MLVKAGCPSPGSLPAPAVPRRGHLAVQSGISRGGSVTVNAMGIPAGDILVAAFEHTTHGRLHAGLGAMKLTSPPAPSCVSLPAVPATGGAAG